MIVADKLEFEYPNKRVLKSVSFEIKAGTVTALVGPNGAGKTTLLRCLCGLLSPFSGSVTVDGLSMSESPRKIHRNMGYLSDFFGVYSKLTVRECLNYNARIQNIPLAQLDDKVLEAAHRVQLAEYLDKTAGELSRGLHQRLGIAQAIIHDPKVILLDEPASGLDPGARMHLSELILKLRDRGATILVSSHIISELEDYCDSILMIRDGKLVSHSSFKDQEGMEQVPQTLVVKLSEPASAYEKVFQSIDALKNVEFEGNTVRASLVGNDSVKNAVLQELIKQGVPVSDFNVSKRRLRDIYMEEHKNV